MKKGLLACVVAVVLIGVMAMPAFADTPGTGNSDFVIQNVDTASAQVLVDYYDQTGTNDVVGGTPITIPVHGSRVFRSATLPVGDGWIGSVVVSSDKQVAAVTTLTWQSVYGNADDRVMGGSYSGTYQPAVDLYFPYATVQPVGNIPGKLNRFSIVTVQNAGTADTHIHLYYYNQVGGGLSAHVEDDIQAGRSRSYNLSLAGTDPKVPNLGSSWQGSVYVHSDSQPIAGVVTTHWANQTYTQWASAYEGVSSGSTTLYGPSVYRFNGESNPSIGTWVRSTNVLVQNLGTVPANITVQFFEVGSSTPKMTINDTIQPKAMGEYNTRFGSPTNPAYTAAVFQANLGDNYNGGSVIINCTNGQPLASVIHTFWWRPNENSASTYSAMPAGATTLFFPYAPRKRATDWIEWSKIAVQNLSASPANITLTYYNPDGSTALTLTGTIAARSTDGYNTRYGSDSGSIPASAFAPLGDNFEGNAVLQSSQPVVAVVNLIYKPIESNTYNGYVP